MKFLYYSAIVLAALGIFSIPGAIEFGTGIPFIIGAIAIGGAGAWYIPRNYRV